MKSLYPIRLVAVCLFAAFLCPTALKAGDVSKEQAIAVAEKIVRENFPAYIQARVGAITVNAPLKSNDPFYVCQTGNEGYVLVARSDHYPPVLGFSYEGSFPSDLSRAPAIIGHIIDRIRTACSEYDSRPETDPSIADQWKEYSSGKYDGRLKSGAISPLLATTWNCDSTFFDLFPSDWRVGGSVAIAMSQVFRYYATPQTGTGELCYILTGHGELCTHFDQALLNFSRMSNTVANSAVDSLVYYMSVTCMLQPLGTQLSAYIQTLPVYFGYSNKMRQVALWKYSISDVILHQLSLRRPVPADWIGHSFVIDGYFPGNLFHFNMGLGGEFDGFYLVDNNVVTVDADHSLLNVYTDYHPKSMQPAPTDLTVAPEGDSLRITWNSNLNDSVRAQLVRFVLLRDGVLPMAQTRDTTMVVDSLFFRGSCKLSVVADFGTHGASELSEPFLYISDETLANIPSIDLREKLNSLLGEDDLLRQPTKGQLELIDEMEVDFPDLRGIELLPNLVNFRIDGGDIRTLRDGPYLPKLKHLRFYDCIDFDFSIFEKTRSLLQLYGYDFLPIDLYYFRHNTDAGLINLTSIGENPNHLMDLYGADKYFPKAADFFLRHLKEGLGEVYDTCFVSIESYFDIFPKVKNNFNLLAHTQPTVFAPCYPDPARETNDPGVTRLSWQSNIHNESGVYYNVFVGNTRANLELVSIFQTDKYYDGTFEKNKDYYWRVEAYHADSTYYSGIYHFSTYQDLPIPFVESFDGYYANCPVAEESPFWKTFDAGLTGKAATNRNVRYGDGFYSLEMKPKSDIGVTIAVPSASHYFVEFRFLNQQGDLTAELLQKSATSADTVVNAKVTLTGSDSGVFTYENSTYPFTYIAGKWNRVNFSLNMTTGEAVFSLNEVPLKTWQWHVQMGGTENGFPFKGIRFVNNAAVGGGSAYIDNMIVDVQDPLSSKVLPLSEVGMIYRAGSREVVFSGIQATDIREVALVDLQGRKVMAVTRPDNLTFRIDGGVPAGIYVILLNRRNGVPFSRKIAIL